MTEPMRKSISISLLLVLLLLSAASSAAQRQTTGRNQPSAQASGGQPRLVLVIVVDQFRYDFLERFSDLYGKNGFKRLIDRGALFTNANYDYVPTFTAPGHAAIFTGSVPRKTA